MGEDEFGGTAAAGSGRIAEVSHDLHALGPDELRAAHTLCAAAILRDPLDDETWEHRRRSYSPGRTFGVSDGSGLTGTASSFPCSTAVPGGAAVPTAAVTRVGVRADRTRRGVLSALMAAQLDDAAARGEVLATLGASEAGIYGRFGYGVATRARHVAVDARTGWRNPATGSVRLLDTAETEKVLIDTYRRIALGRAGAMTRPDHLWERSVSSRVRHHQHLLVAVHTGRDGDDGYAVAVAEPGDGFSGRTLRVTDLHAADLPATAGLWRFLLDVDLVGRVVGGPRPLDEPLDLLLADPRAVTVTGEEDELWVRLIDVPAALAARSWGAGEAVLVGVHDRLRPQNDGVYRIGDGGAERVDGAAPELGCDVSALAMAYLGDRAPSRLVATGWWSAADPSVSARADRVFTTDTVPWCGTFF